MPCPIPRPRSSRTVVSVWCTLVALFIAVPAFAGEGPIHIKYWDKWTGNERAAMQAVVDDFHASQDRIRVDFLSVSQIVEKTLIATAGGNPPDVAGVWANDVIDYAHKGAVTPLDDLARGTIVNRERYLPVYWDMGVYEGKLYGVPSTPGTTALHWNKRAFREAGLDPERPPRTIAELDEYAEKLTRKEGGKITQIGFLHTQPPWWPFFWVYFFDGKLWDGGANILLDAPENVRAFTWVQSYAKRYGVQDLQTMSEGFGNFASAQNPFMSGKLAMVFQGVWMANYIDQFAPDLEWGAAPFPVLHEGDPPVVFVDSDMLVIPRGARHVEEAFEFLRFVSRQESTEKLNLGQRKNSPLRDVSDNFFARHKHPYIRLFQDLAKSPRAIGQPKMGVWREYRDEIETVFQSIWLDQMTPERALREAKGRIQVSWDRVRKRRERPQQRAIAFAPIVLCGIFALAIAILSIRQRRRQAPRGGRRSARSNASWLRGLAFFSPWGIGLTVFIGYPVMASLVYSFCDYSVLQAPRFVGFANYTDLFGDEVFYIALRNTLIYVSFALPLGLALSFSVALLLDAGVRGSGVYRTLVFLPALTPVVASALVWIWIFNAEHGVLNDLLARVSGGRIAGHPWLSDPRTALPSIVLMSFWAIGHSVVIFLAALQDVPSAIYEAAEIDGARFWHKVWHITLPTISPVLYFNAIMGLIGGLQIFTQPYIMTGGGPARATLTYTMRLYEMAFKFLQMGYASAMAWIFFVVIVALTALSIRLGKGRVHYVGA